MADLLIRAVDPDARLRIVAAITTDLTQEAARRHGLTGVGACALGRGLTSGLLLATLAKAEERVTLQIRGSGALGGLTVDASVEVPVAGATAEPRGGVRGYVNHPEAATAPCPGRGRLVDHLGRVGVVNVVRDIGQHDRYQGQVPLLTGEIDEDVEHYLRTSEQVPSALGCDVLLRDGRSIDGAAGVLIQALPGAGVDPVWESLHAVRSGAVYQFLVGGGRDAEALARAVYGRPMQVLSSQPVHFRCRCSALRVREMLRLLTVIDLDEMIADPGQAEVTCNYCSTRYVVGREDLEHLRTELRGGPRGNN